MKHLPPKPGILPLNYDRWADRMTGPELRQIVERLNRAEASRAHLLALVVQLLEAGDAYREVVERIRLEVDRLP